MKLFFAITITILFLAPAQAQTIPSWKIAKLEEWIREADSAVIVNFWATWCKPCISEIPYFESLVKKYAGKGVKLLLVSLDMEEQYPVTISSVVQKRKFISEVIWLNETNADYFCPKIDSSWSGALPSTLFINNKRGYRKFYEEAMPEQKLEQAIKEMIGD